MGLGIGYGTTEEFIKAEFEDLKIGDKRLNKRFFKIMTTMQNRLGSYIRRLFLDPKEARQAYDFFW